MRNLKIGTRIFMAFSIVIVLMLISAIVVYFANTGILGNVDKISKDSVLQTTGNELKDNFLLTRIAAVRLLSTTDAEVYESFASQASTTADIYKRIYTIIDENDFLEKFRPLFEKAESDYAVYIGKANELGAANADEKTQIERMAAAGADMETYGDLIFRDQIELLRSEINAGGASADAQNRRVDRIVSGADIALNTLEFRMYANGMMSSFDTSDMPKALELIDSAYQITEGYHLASTIPLNIENSKLLMDTIAEYQNALVGFGEACDYASVLASELSPLGLTALNSLSDAVVALDTALAGQVDATTKSASSTLIIVMAISLISIIIAVYLATVIIKGITTPVKKMVQAADALALGDVDVDVTYDSKDEIGLLSVSFYKMLDGIKAQVSAVEKLSDGDLTINVSPRSDRDTMGYGLQKMVDSLNGMFGEINVSTAQVSEGSRQLADGAQSLSQGTTEQAAAVEQLSSSISEIAEKTRENANMAAQAADMANAIMNNAQKGSRQMDEMMEAVNEINAASQSINKVIKVIDDIAFQTNILALNAAVEAARAGQHGKGFAVVAEEVRNLAAKSAEAAKDTGSLIANSMEKAELGARMAGETAVSLTEIVSGITESSRLVADIAKSSEEQSAGITQINKGIEQVAQVIQQNSATAEQSAAASEEMSSQAITLEQLVAQFKLRDSHYGTSVGSTPQQRAMYGSSTHMLEAGRQDREY